MNEQKGKFLSEQEAFLAGLRHADFVMNELMTVEIRAAQATLDAIKRTPPAAEVSELEQRLDEAVRILNNCLQHGFNGSKDYDAAEANKNGRDALELVTLLTPPAVPEKCGTCGGDKKWCHRGSCSFVEGGRLNTRGICEFSETCANRQPCPDCTPAPTAAPEKCELCGGTKVVIVNLSDTEEVPCPSCTPAPTVTYTRNCAKCGAVVPKAKKRYNDELAARALLDKAAG